MPPLSNSLPRRWSPSELPILPFLAPRVFQPWPSKSARAHLETKTGGNQDDNNRVLWKVKRRKDAHPKCLGGTSPNFLMKSGTKYTGFKQRRTTPTSFARVDLRAHRSIRYFSSDSGLGRGAENNASNGSTVGSRSEATHGSGTNAPLEAQRSTGTSTHQDSRTVVSVDTSTPLRPRLVQSTRGGARHLQLNAVFRRVSLNEQDVSPPRNIDPSRAGDPITLSAYDISEFTSQQSSSLIPPSSSPTENVAVPASLHPLSSGTPLETSSSSPGSVRTVKSKRPRRKSTKPISRRRGQPIRGTFMKNMYPTESGFFRRPRGYRFYRDEFQRPSLLENKKKTSDRRRHHYQRLATMEGPFQELRKQYELWGQQQGLPTLPTKYLKINRDERANILELQMWSSQFAIIHQRYEDALKGYPKLKFKEVAVSRYPVASRLLFIQQDNVAALANIWRRVPTEIRAHVWEELMLTSMDQYPASTLKLLLATYQAPSFPPRWAASDCLDFVVSHYFGSEERKSTRESFTAHDLRQIFDSITYLHIRGLRLSARSVYLLQSMMNLQEFKAFHHVLTRTRQHLTGKTLLRFTYRFARSQETDLAFQVLQQATEQGINLNLERWPQICHVLLARKYRDPYAEVTDTELFDFMLHHGLRPTIVTYNILIQNSLEAGDHVTAWQIYDMMIDNKVMADVYTYSIMLNDAKIRKDDAAVEKLTHWMDEDGVRNSYTITDVLDTVFRLNRQEYFKRPPSERKALPTPFSQMLPIYMQNFHVESLAQLIPRFEENFLGSASTKFAPEEDNTSVETPRGTSFQAEPDQHHPDHFIMAKSETTVLNRETEYDLMEPNHVTLIVMLKSYIASVRNYKALLGFYDNFKSLISAQNPIVAPLLKEAQVYNHLLVELGHANAPMADCLRIVADMQKSPSNSRHFVSDTETEHSHDENNISEELSTSDKIDAGTNSDDMPFYRTDATVESFQPPRPSIHTWTTLLNVFMQRHQPRAAEKVLQIMIEKEGLEPNQATWNALTMGYMRLQDPLMTADALIRTKKSGFIVDHIMSSRWWLRFQARARLSEALESASDGNETSLVDVANSMESEITDPAEEEIIDEEVLEATTSQTGDIYRILKRRLHAVNSPVHPNWIFDAMLRVDEENMIEQEAEPIFDDSAKFEIESTQYPDILSVTKQNLEQFPDSQDTGASSLDNDAEQGALPSDSKDGGESRLLPANRLIVRKCTIKNTSPQAKAFLRRAQFKGF